MTFDHAATARRRRGFSLLELMAVMVIIGTIASIAVPRYTSSLSRFRVEAASRRMVEDLQFARARARTTGARVTIEFDNSTGHKYWMPGVPDPLRPRPEYRVELRREPIVCTLGPVSFDAQKRIAFSPHGEPVHVAGGAALINPGTIVIRSGSAEKTVMVDPATGEVTVQ